MDLPYFVMAMTQAAAWEEEQHQYWGRKTSLLAFIAEDTQEPQETQAGWVTEVGEWKADLWLGKWQGFLRLSTAETNPNIPLIRGLQGSNFGQIGLEYTAIFKLGVGDNAYSELIQGNLET